MKKSQQNLPTWASKLLLRTDTHNRNIQKLTKQVLENPKNKTKVMQLFAEAKMLDGLLDQIVSRNEEIVNDLFDHLVSQESETHET